MKMITALTFQDSHVITIKVRVQFHKSLPTGYLVEAQVKNVCGFSYRQ